MAVLDKDYEQAELHDGKLLLVPRKYTIVYKYKPKLPEIDSCVKEWAGFDTNYVHLYIIV
jgi:hypothetical protein